MVNDMTHIGIGIRIGQNIQSDVYYWTHQTDLFLFFGETSKITGGRLYNQMSGSTDWLNIAGVSGSETYQTPNTAAYIAADTDYIWFKTDTTQRTTTTAELIGYDLQRTPVKYDDNAPNTIRWIAILKPTGILTASQRNRLFSDFRLPILWDNSLNPFGRIKSNRGANQQLWTVESVHEAEVSTYIVGLATPLSAGQLTLLDTFVADLKSGLSISALSDAFDTMYILGGETQESSLRNLVKNAHHGTSAAMPTFTQFEGFKGNASTQYIDTNYNPSTDADNYTLNNCSVGIYSRTNSSSDTIVDYGSSDGTQRTLIQIKIASTELYGCMNNLDANWYGVGSITNSLGMRILGRNGAGAGDMMIHINTSLSTSFAGAGNTSALPNKNFTIGGWLSGATIQNPSNRQYSFFYTGRYLTPTEKNILVNTFEAYMDANGKGVI